MTDSKGNKLPSFKSSKPSKVKDRRVKLQSLPELDKLMDDFDSIENKNPEDIKKVEEAINKIKDEEEISLVARNKSKSSRSVHKPKLPDFENIYDDDFNLSVSNEDERLVEDAVEDDINSSEEVSKSVEKPLSEKVELNEGSNKVNIDEHKDSYITQIDNKENSNDELNVIYKEPEVTNEDEEVDVETISEDDVELQDNKEGFSDNEDTDMVDYQYDKEETYDDEDDYEEDFSFLPTVNIDEDDVNNEDELEDEEYYEEDNLYNNDDYEDSKEIDEEAIKDFFNNLKNKIFGERNRKSKEAKSTKIDNESNVDSGGAKIKIKKEYILYPLIVIAVIGVVFLLINLIGGNYSTLDDMSFSAENEDSEISVEFSEFSYDNSNELISYTVTNKGEVSADFFFEAEMKEKKIIPFTGDSITCESDIIELEPDGSSLETIKCDGFNEDSKYKPSVDIIEVK